MMELTAEQFAEIVGHLNGLAGPDSSRDKRRATRIERRTRITITPVASGGAGGAASGTADAAPASIVVMVKNLSSRGMALVADRELPNGSQFMFRLARQDGTGVPVDLLCTVVHCDEVADRVHSIGAEFTCIVGDGIKNTAGGGDEAQRIRSSILE